MASKRELKEADVVRTLRIMVAVALGFGVLAIGLGYTHVTVFALDYSERIERAGGDELSIWILIMLVPAGWVFRKPRWAQLVMWIMWLTTWLMLGGILAIGHDDPSELVTPAATRPLITFSVIAMAAIVTVGMPLVRRTHRSPPASRPTTLPAARVVDRS